MVLLLLGLAFLLATSSSLLATSGSGRGDKGGSIPPVNNDYPEHGEISGSVSVTSLGELWLTIFVDNFSILAQIDVVDDTNGELSYKFSIAGIAELVDKTEGSKLKDKSQTRPEVLFKTPEEATERLTALVKSLGIELSKASLCSAPFAVQNGWHPPEECYAIIQSLIEENRGK